jgi:hypothetical protein
MCRLLKWAPLECAGSRHTVSAVTEERRSAVVAGLRVVGGASDAPGGNGGYSETICMFEQ